MTDEQQRHSRRAFLSGAAGSAGIIAAGSLVRSRPALAAQDPGPDQRGVPAETTDARLEGDTFLFQLEGDTVAQTLVAVGGGGVSTPPQVSEDGRDRSFGGVEYEPLTIEMTTGGSDATKSWIAETLGDTAEGGVRKSGSILAYAQDHVRARFTNAFISEIALPTLDASSAGPASLRLRITPDAIDYATDRTPPREVKSQKKWLQSNFRFTLGSIDCTRVSKIESFTIKQKVIESNDPLGSALAPLRSGPATTMDVAPIRLRTFDRATAFAFVKWQDDAIAAGASRQVEQQGMLVIRDEEGRDAARVGLTNVGPVAVTTSRMQDATGALTRAYDIELYCERVSFDLLQ